jgi:hypothetical protein
LKGSSIFPIETLGTCEYISCIKSPPDDPLSACDAKTLARSSLIFYGRLRCPRGFTAAVIGVRVVTPLPFLPGEYLFESCFILRWIPLKIDPCPWVRE